MELESLIVIQYLRRFVGEAFAGWGETLRCCEVGLMEVDQPVIAAVPEEVGR